MALRGGALELKDTSLRATHSGKHMQNPMPAPREVSFEERAPSTALFPWKGAARAGGPAAACTATGRTPPLEPPAQNGLPRDEQNRLSRTQTRGIS